MAFVRFKEREEMSMKNDDNKIKDVKSTVNLISGAYTLPLIDKLFSNSQRIEDMDDIYFSITALVDTDRISEAFHMIRGLFGIAGMEYPQEIAQLEKSEELQIRRRSHSWKNRKNCRNLLCRNLFLIFMM